MAPHLPGIQDASHPSPLRAVVASVELALPSCISSEGIDPPFAGRGGCVCAQAGRGAIKVLVAGFEADPSTRRCISSQYHSSQEKQCGRPIHSNHGRQHTLVSFAAISRSRYDGRSIPLLETPHHIYAFEWHHHKCCHPKGRTCTAAKRRSRH